MFEVLILFLFLLINSFVNSQLFFVVGFIFILILILPGLYSLLFGAPFIASGAKRVKGILELAEAKKGDKVSELGCGDARIVRQFWRMGVKDATGYEFSFPTFLWAYLLRYLSKTGEGIVFANFWKKDFSEDDVLVCFLMDRAMEEFEKKIWPTLKPGAKVVTNEFVMPNVKPDKNIGRVYLYVRK